MSMDDFSRNTLRWSLVIVVRITPTDHLPPHGNDSVMTGSIG